MHSPHTYTQWMCISRDRSSRTKIYIKQQHQFGRGSKWNALLSLSLSNTITRYTIIVHWYWWILYGVKGSTRLAIHSTYTRLSIRRIVRTCYVYRTKRTVCVCVWVCKYVCAFSVGEGIFSWSVSVFLSFLIEPTIYTARQRRALHSTNENYTWK